MKSFRNISQLITLEGVHKKDGRHLLPEDLSILNNASIVFEQNKIHWVGEDKDFPPEYTHASSEDMSGVVITPEIVDSHTHTVFAGNRAKEYAMRLNGADYQEIAHAGGGILATMTATNAASEQELYDSAYERIKRIQSYGVGTIEIKSGYALNLEKEYQISKIIKKLKDDFSGEVQIFNTFMAAHAVPKTFASSSLYLDEVVLPLLTKLAHENIIDGVDIFHEKGYFDTKDVKSLFTAAKKLNLPVKIHADEFQDNGGAKLATSFGAHSADHLLCTSQEGIKALAQSSTVATLLPGTGYFLGKSQADAAMMLKEGVKLALASDYNPGSCHCDNLLLLASLSAPSLGLNTAQLWAAITYNASHALGLIDQGCLIPGMKPRFSIFKVEDISEITYSWGRNFAIT